MKLSIKDIYYKTENDGKIVESRKGFLPLKKMLPIWIKEKIKEYEK
jgi:predicted RNA-binding protein with RPS1 domain